MRRARSLALLALLALASPALGEDEAPGGSVAIGSKNFTESHLLAEILAQLIEARTELEVERRFDLSGTKIAFGALEQGDIDLYPEYSGTATVALLGQEPSRDPLETYLAARRGLRERFDLVLLSPFGFSNTFALAIPQDLSERLDVETISELAPHAADLRCGVSPEFLTRKDGFPGLKQLYGLEFESVRSMDHGLAYEGIESGEIEVVNAFSTDGKLLRYRLVVLEDDQGFFPHYHAAPLVRADTLTEHPELRPLLERLALRLSAERMTELNFQVEEQKRSFARVAGDFLRAEGLIEGQRPQQQAAQGARAQGFWALFASRWRATLRLTAQHLELTGAAVLLAVLIAVPLGILCTRRPGLAQPVLGGAGVIQTVPSLALLAFMIPIPFLGLSDRSAIVALFLYALLPIVRNTYTGIREVDPDLIEAARGMGLSEGQILRVVQLPLAVRTIMAGVRTATVISVGVATLAAFIGAGGLGEPIITGLALNDTNLILSGAIPAASLAIVVDALLGLVERWLVPRGLQIEG